MRCGNRSVLAWGLVVLVISAAAGTVLGWADGPSADAPRGEIVIKPTGRKVRVVSTSAPAQSRPQVTTPAPVLVRPALLSLTATTAPRVTRAAFEQGLDFG